jgi:hypothetical protein
MHPLHYGTLSWDIKIASLLPVVLQSALAARARDIGLSPQYTKEFLKYEDMKLVLDKAPMPSTQDLKATFSAEVRD